MLLTNFYMVLDLLMVKVLTKTILTRHLIS